MIAALMMAAAVHAAPCPEPHPSVPGEVYVCPNGEIREVPAAPPFSNAGFGVGLCPGPFPEPKPGTEWVCTENGAKMIRFEAPPYIVHVKRLPLHRWEGYATMDGEVPLNIEDVCKYAVLVIGDLPYKMEADDGVLTCKSGAVVSVVRKP